MDRKFDALTNIYEEFDRRAASYRGEAACRRGCAFCCTSAGSIDITTLEGIVILQAIDEMPRSRQGSIRKQLSQDVRKREKKMVTPCPFLLKNNACMIYNSRPFACRRIYSLHVCSKDAPPMLSRLVMEEAQRTLKDLQVLDKTGYSGHISFILFMLNHPKFRKTYLAGDFRPEEIMDFGKTHRIVINNMMI